MLLRKQTFSSSAGSRFAVIGLKFSQGKLLDPDFQGGHYATEGRQKEGRGVEREGGEGEGNHPPPMQISTTVFDLSVKPRTKQSA